MSEKNNQWKLTLKRSEDYYVKVLLKETKLKDFMTKEVAALNVSAKFSDVPKMFKKFKVRHLAVVNEENCLVGIMSQRDLYKIQPPKKLMDGTWYYDDDVLNNIILSEVMTRKLFTLHPDDSMGDALVAMAEKKYGCIPIVDKKKKICGIITQVDILRVAAQIYNE